MEDDGPPAAAPTQRREVAPPPPSLLDVAGSLLRDLPGLVSDRVELLSLELRRAGLALAQIVALVVMIGILAATAWLALWAGIAAALVAWGLPLGWVILTILVLNLGAAAIAASRVRVLARLLGLPATVRRLTLAVPKPEPAAASEPPTAAATPTP